MAYDRNRAIQGNYRPSRRKGAPKSVHITAALVWITGFLFATPTFIKATVLCFLLILLRRLCEAA